MENAADALKMAGAVLIFVLAISIIILAFGQVRETADIILDYKDRETTYVYYEDEGVVRTVNLETIIPTIFRAHLENYKVVFEGLDKPIYSVVQNDGSTQVDKYSIDLTEEVLGNDQKKAEFLCGILYHDFTNINKPDYITDCSSGKEYFEKYLFSITIKLSDKSLYEQLKGKKITEHIGVYYYNNDPNTPDSKKQKKRVITYKVNN